MLDCGREYVALMVTDYKRRYCFLCVFGLRRGLVAFKGGKKQ